MEDGFPRFLAAMSGVPLEEAMLKGTVCGHSLEISAIMREAVHCGDVWPSFVSKAAASMGGSLRDLFVSTPKFSTDGSVY